MKSDESDCGIGWEIYYGTVSTSSKITGSNSAALRLYTSSNYGYIKSTTPVEGLSKVDFNAKAATSNGAKIKINVSYSTDGNSWISLETDKALTASAVVYSYDIPSGGKFFQIAISSESTKPSKSNAQLTIDDVVFTYSDLGKENVDLSFGEISSQTVGVGKSVKVEATATPSVPISYSSSDETIAIVSTDGTVTGKKPGTTTIKASFAGNDQYNSASDEYELTVIPSELGGDVTEETIIINEPYGNSGNNAIILYDKGTNGQNGPFYYNNSELRLYCGNTLTVSSESKKIGKIEFDFVVNHNSNGVIPESITYTSGSCEVFNKLSTSLTSAIWNAPTNGVSEVTFTIKGSAGNVGFKSAKVYYVLKSFDVAPASNNESYGTVSFEEGVITATPAEGYRVSLTNPYEVTPAGAATVVQDGNDFTVTATADCTVQINFEAIPTHTVTFSVNGTETSKSFAEGSNITFDTPDDVQGKKFVGWTTATIDGTTDECPELVTLGTMGNADVTYYAVFANKEGTFENASITINSDSENVPTSYGTANTFDEYTLAGKKFQIQQMYKNGEKLQWRADGNKNGTGTMYNSEAIKSIQSIVLNYDIDDSNKNFTVKVGADANPTNGEEIAAITDGSIQTFDCAAQNCDYFVLTNGSGAGYLTSLTINYLLGSVTYSDYCTTVVEPVTLSAPIIFHDGGEYEGTLTVAMAGEGTIKYTLNGDEQTYTAPFTISETTTITAWTEQDGAKSDEVEKTFTIVEKAKGAVVEDGYYTIQTNDDDGKYVNVAGRKTVTLVSDNEGKAGTVIRVKADAEGVKVLRSQAVDLPRYAERAMSYVPELVKEVVKKLAANVDDPIIGEQGADLILDKFNKEFDYHLYLEGENNTYRIYGRTPSMKPVVDFYAENKELIDGRLLKVEGFVKEVLQKVVDKVGRGQSVVDMFKVKTIWQNMGGTLTEPTDDASTLKFYEEVLSSETNVWNFAYQTGMLYWEKVKGYLTENAGSLGDYGKYIEKIPQIRPNFKYYIVPGENGVDIISEGNSQITDASTAWTLTKRTGFDVTFDATLSKNNGKEMYKTLYVDFAYKLPENVKALKVESVSDAGVAVTKEITGVVPAQTPVLLMSTDVENLTKTLALSTADGAAVTNELKGNDWLINKYKINTPELETIFAMLTKLSSSLGEKYEYLKRKNSGTVNNKYFFGLSVPTKEGDFKEAFMNGKIKVLTNGEKGLGFYSNFDKNLVGNEVFMFSEDTNPILLTLKGDVNRDGSITIADVTALVNIILGKATYPADADKYDFEAAHVNADEDITIADVTALVNIILGKTQN